MKNTAVKLANKENAERWKSVMELEKFGKPASDYLIEALKDEDRWVRYLAADALANIGASHSVSNLITLLKDPDQDVRFAAASALGKLGDKNALADLEATVKHDNGYVRIAAEEAISRIATT
jgi:HEAT repeat protein